MPVANSSLGSTRVGSVWVSSQLTVAMAAVCAGTRVSKRAPRMPTKQMVRRQHARRVRAHACQEQHGTQAHPAEIHQGRMRHGPAPPADGP